MLRHYISKTQKQASSDTSFNSMAYISHLTDTVTTQIPRFELHWPQYCILSPDVPTASWWQTQFHSQWFSEINKWDWKHLNVRLHYSCTCLYVLEHDVTQSAHQCTGRHMFGFSSFRDSWNNESQCQLFTIIKKDDIFCILWWIHWCSRAMKW